MFGDFVHRSSILGAAKTFTKLAVFCNLDFIGAGHLWFLLALSEAYIVLLIADKFGAWSAAYAHMIFAFIASGIIYAVAPLRWHLLANLFMSGMSWVMLGRWIAENFSTLSNIDRRIFIASALTDWLVSLLSLAGQLLFISQIGRNDTLMQGNMVKIGTDYSLYVYLFHILAWRIYSFMMRRFGSN